MSSTGKEYNDLILDLLKEQGKDISDIKEDIAELKSARHVIKEHKEWKLAVNDVWSPKNMDSAHKEIYIQKGKWNKWMGILIGVQLVVGVIIFFLKE